MIGRNIFFLICWMSCASVLGQWTSYSQQQALPEGLSGGWYRVPIPDTAYTYLRQDLHDLRIYGTNAGGDTLEMPYVLQHTDTKTTLSLVAFRLLNESQLAGESIFTFEMPKPVPINQIGLDFEGDNFSYMARLEGSHDQQQWFEVLKDYRLLAINNDLTRYRFETLRFPESNYRYFRLWIRPAKKEERVALQKATLRYQDQDAGTYTAIQDLRWSAQNDNQPSRRTTITIDLPALRAVSRLHLHISDTLPYYRPIAIAYLRDSIKTDKGWQYRYENLYNGTLSALEKSVFSFPQTILKKMRIEIYHADNLPLTIADVQASNYQNYLLTRISQQGNFHLVYGWTDARPPNYDLTKIESLPENATPVVLSPPQAVSKPEVTPPPKPLFEDERWLWAVLVLLIVLLGGLSLRMMKKAEKS
ncbi:MAG: DUF3999 family protein [Bernardetiaceae bacterium]